MKKLCIILFAAMFLFGAEYGKITGRVSDAETGEPLIGADVIIEGTELGAATDENGTYVVLYVPAGTYQVSASYISYNPYTYTTVVVNADQTTNIDFRLPPTVIQVEGVTAIAERPMIVASQTQTGRAVTSTELDRLPVTTINQVITLQAGVVQSDLGTHIRGGRNNEITYFVDGIVTKVPNFGTQSARVSATAVEEVSIVSGGFDAEYGDALSGIINVVTREGGSNISGNIRYLTNDIFPTQNLNRGFNQYNVSVGGPLPFTNRLRYFLSGELMMTDAWEIASYNVTSPRIEYRAQGRFTYLFPNAKGKLSFTGFNSREQFVHWSPYVAGGNNLKYFENKPMTRIKNTIGSTTLNYMLTAQTLTSLKIGVTDYEFFYGNRDYEWENENDYQWYDDYRFRAEHLVPDLMDSDYQRDHDITIKDIMIDSLMAYHTEYTNRDVAALRNNPYGIEGWFYTHGDFRNWTYMNNQDYQLRSDITHTMNKIHEFKAGFDYTKYRMSFFNNNLPWVTNPFWDYYDRSPYKVAMYLQDKMDFEGLIARIGVRIDYFDPKTTTYLEPGNQLNDTIIKADANYKISPRLGFSLPVTERTKLRFNYGHYFQLPGLANMYTSTDTSVVRLQVTRGNSILGNVLLKPERTTQYEVGVEHQFTDNVALAFTAYFKDIYDLAQIREVLALPTPYFQFFNVDYGNVKGIEVNFSKRMSDMWAFGAAYTLQFAKGTASFAGEFYNDYYLYNIDPPVIDYWLDFDERHILNTNLDLNIPADFVFIPLRHVTNSFVVSYHSGHPYTPQDLRGNRIGDENSARMPAYWNVDWSFSRAIPLGPVAFTINGIITNLFNTAQPIEVYQTTGLPDDHGDLEPTLSQFGNISHTSSRYSPQADANHDGLINPVEQKHAFILSREAFYEDPTNFNNPLQINIGVGLTF